MILDIVFALILLGAFYNGYTKGIIYSVFSFFALILGVIIAMNFSTMMSVWLSKSFNIPPIIMPSLSFILVLIAVVAAVKLAAMLAEKFLKAVMLNFANKMAGGVLWAALASMVFGLLVFLISKTGVFTEQVIAQSFTYKYIMPLGPFTLKAIQSLVPYLKESFDLLNNTVKDFVPPQ